MPLVSVVIPTHDRAHLVGRAITSVLQQTLADWECVVVDDASTDATGETVRSFRDPRIRYLRHEVNKGASAARNTGVQAARGEYVAFLDSDDEWLPDKLARQIELFGSSEVHPGVIYTAAYRVNSVTAETRLTRPRLRGDVFRDVLLRQQVNLTTVIVKADLIRSVGGFDEQLPRGEDRDLFIRLAAVATFDGISDPLARHYVHDGPHLNGNTATGIVYKRRLIEKLSSMPRVPKRTLSYHHRSFGLLLLRAKSYEESLGQMLASVRCAPADPRPYVGIARVASVWAVASSRRWLRTLTAAGD
jgi:glycosyltransferase involved in cell wall biosynthesis